MPGRRGSNRFLSDDLTDSAPADQSRNGEQNGDDRPFELLFAHLFCKVVNVVGRTAVVAAVEGVFSFVRLRQRAFNERGGRTENGDQPHPEYRTRATRRDGGDDAHQVSHADASGGGNDE